MNPSFHVGNDHEDLSRRATGVILTALARKPNLLLCAAGGSTPLRTYQSLAEHYAQKPETFHTLRVMKLDEWGGLTMDDPGTCEQQLRTHLINPLRLSEDRYFGFASHTSDPDAECKRVHDRLACEGPIDLCVLGLGVNGHVGMNEPASALQPFAHVATLTESSMQHSMLVRAKTRPSHGLTLGMGELLASRAVLLLVGGANKREPLARLLERKICTEFPASFLWLHPAWTLLCDREAAGALKLKP